MQEQIFGLKCLFLYSNPDNVPFCRRQALCSSAQQNQFWLQLFCCGALALPCFFFFFFLPVEMCRMVPNCGLETGIMPVVFTPTAKATCICPIPEFHPDTALLDPKLQLSGTANSPKRQRNGSEITFFGNKKPWCSWKCWSGVCDWLPSVSLVRH